jgi:hypothetical protein
MENGVPVNTAEAPETDEEKKMDRKDSDSVNIIEKPDGFFKKHWKKLAAGGAALIAAAGGAIAIFATRDKEETEDDDPEQETSPKTSLDDIGEKLDSLLSKFDELE